MIRKIALGAVLGALALAAQAQSLAEIAKLRTRPGLVSSAEYDDRDAPMPAVTLRSTGRTSGWSPPDGSGNRPEISLDVGREGNRLPGTGKADPPLPTVAGEAFVPAARLVDYEANAASNVFGAQLFTGSFSKAAAATFNPDYTVSIGDTIRLRMWGGYDFDGTLTVDPQGAIFLPHRGPLRIVGTRNRDLQATVSAALRKVFSEKVAIYASLQSGQPVRVYVTGFVRHPGMYEGTGGDSVLKYLDLAGGIDPDRGTFLDVQVKRGAETRAHIDLYRFLTSGLIDTPQLVDGDLVFVGPRHNVVAVEGLASNARLFEFGGTSESLAALVELARPDPRSTNVRITRSHGEVQNVEYYAVSQAPSLQIYPGDVVAFTADKQRGTITVRVEGEHRGPREYVVPYGTDLARLMKGVQPSTRSNFANLQLFRASVREKQAKLLSESLIQLQNSALTARSGTNEEAQLREREAALVLQWVDKARSIEPRGQIVVGSGPNWKDVVLENGDVVNVPPRDGMVLVGGEVLFPNTMVYQPGLRLNDYIQLAGGYTQNADSSRTVIAHEDGTFVDSRHSNDVRVGDQILVLPKVDFKTRQFAKDVFTVLYQIAISAKVAIGL